MKHISKQQNRTTQYWKIISIEWKNKESPKLP